MTDSRIVPSSFCTPARCLVHLYNASYHTQSLTQTLRSERCRHLYIPTRIAVALGHLCDSAKPCHKVELRPPSGNEAIVTLIRGTTDMKQILKRIPITMFLCELRYAAMYILGSWGESRCCTRAAVRPAKPCSLCTCACCTNRYAFSLE